LARIANPAYEVAWRRSGNLLAAAWFDLRGGLERCLEPGARALVWIFLGLAVGWWLTVPLHELSHVGACWAAGGRVTRLEIDPLYGGALLARWLPFVAPASAYAGRLSGFDTGGRDLVYLATDLGPYLWTLFPGVWAWRRAGRRGRGFAFGLWMPLALATFLSATGDAYEIGSLAVTRLPAWSDVANRALLRGDDLLLRAHEIGAHGAAAPWAGFVLAAALGVAWAFAWYALASAIATWLGEAPLAERSSPAAAS
jgi:hypothetical protein